MYGAVDIFIPHPPGLPYLNVHLKLTVPKVTVAHYKLSRTLQLIQFLKVEVQSFVSNLFFNTFKPRVRAGVKIGIFPTPIAHWSGVGIFKQNREHPDDPDGWTFCFTHTQKCPVEGRVKKRISSKYFKTNQNAKLCFCPCLNFGQF